MPKFVVYSSPSCMACRQTQNSISKQNIDITKIDVTEDQDALDRLRAKGYFSIPVVEVIDNDSIIDTWVGFRPDKISQFSN
jgi:glutaredoxin-like protein NrdH